MHPKRHYSSRPQPKGSKLVIPHIPIYSFQIDANCWPGTLGILDICFHSPPKYDRKTYFVFKNIFYTIISIGRCLFMLWKATAQNPGIDMAERDRTRPTSLYLLHLKPANARRFPVLWYIVPYRPAKSLHMNIRHVWKLHQVFRLYSNP